jgi:hypothetical protein
MHARQRVAPKRYTELWKELARQARRRLRPSFPDQKDRKAYAYLLMLMIDGLTVQEALEQSDATSMNGSSSYRD